MIGVVFYLEEAHATMCSAFVGDTFSELLYDAEKLGATHVLVVDKTGGKAQFYNHSSSILTLEIYGSLEEIETEYAGETFVYLENEDTFLTGDLEYDHLHSYTHPVSCIYVTGPNSGTEDVIVGKEGDFVCIDEVEDMWSKTAIMLMLYHRKIS